ncbi:MAG: hypothetical protein CVT59_10880 [Actinobacteria bacterium HGW-Actinobacteria-1]|jgi:hypothetical protein|nr:MAG: hypothetical protein CVT59_10880 [Actinobacteria bacterium HGW-Actinobacteria-1]
MPLRADKKPLLDPRRRRTLLRAGLVVLAILVLLVLPGYLASRPGFFSKYPVLAEKYGPWSKSTHAEAGCETCHVPPTFAARTAYRVRMIGTSYASLVSRSKAPDVFKTPTNDACLVCHSDLRSVSPAGDLQIPHRAHVTVLKMKCVECHDFLVHEVSPEGKHTPPMVGCLTCHDGDKAKNACTACHTEKAAPETHSKADWLVLHGGHRDDAECATCHKWKADWCADCHAQRPPSHVTDWRATHGAAIAKHRSCEACHEAPFCVRCHGEVPSLNFNAALKVVK